MCVCVCVCVHVCVISNVLLLCSSCVVVLVIMEHFPLIRSGTKYKVVFLPHAVSTGLILVFSAHDSTRLELESHTEQSCEVEWYAD